MLSKYLYIKLTNQMVAIATHITIAVLLSLLISYLVKIILLFIQKHSKKLSDNAFYHGFIHAIIKPLSLLIIILGILLATEESYNITHNKFLSAVASKMRIVRESSISIATFWFALLFIKHTEKNIIAVNKKKNKIINYSNIGAISKLLYIAVLIIAIITIMHNLGLDVSGLLTFGGLGGIIIGFAAKDTLANFFGLISIYLDRPFSIGEWIRCIGQSEIEGKVEKIGWRMTQIRKFDKRLLYVPNSIFAVTPIENPSRMTHRRIHESIKVQYDKDSNEILTLTANIKEVIAKHEDVDNNSTISVTVNGIGKRIIELQIYCFIGRIEYKFYREARQNLLINIANSVKKNNFEMVLPNSSVGIMEETSLEETDLLIR